MNRTLSLGLLALLAAGSALARADDARFSAADLGRLADVSEPALSRDGAGGG